jgi:hypothetical protein
MLFDERQQTADQQNVQSAFRSGNAGIQEVDALETVVV